MTYSSLQPNIDPLASLTASGPAAMDGIEDADEVKEHDSHSVT